MNQTYLKGYASDMTQEEQKKGVIFVATPRNVAAFVASHPMASELKITTLNGNTFLTGCGGFVDRCPDQEYLHTVLLPALVPMQQGKMDIPELVHADEQARGYECPVPDWNYMRWDGLEDEAYFRWQAAGLLEAEVPEVAPDQLLPYSRFGEKHRIQLVFQMYSEGNLGIEMYTHKYGEVESWGMLTVNLYGKCPKDCAFIDTNDNGPEIMRWIKRHGLGHPTGHTSQSGYCTYPEVQFEEEFLKKLNPRAYEVYAAQFNEQPDRRRSRSDPER